MRQQIAIEEPSALVGAAGPSRPEELRFRAAVRLPPARRAIRLGEASGPYRGELGERCGFVWFRRRGRRRYRNRSRG